MKYEIIYTDDYALIVNDEEMKKGDYSYNKRCGVFKKVVGYRPLKNEPILEGVPMLPEFRQEDDLEKLANDYANQFAGTDDCVADIDFIEGYKKAKETYKYTEEELINFHQWAFQKVRLEESDKTTKEMLVEWQSLQQPKLPKYFECETEPLYEWVGVVKGVFGSGHKLKNELAGQPKTITNSQGQTEIVGNYIF